jgi:lipopolysaccharide exporter
MSNATESPSNNGSSPRQPAQEDLSSLSKRVRHGALWSSLSTVVLRLTNICITAVVAHILTPRDFGVFTVALTAYTITASLGELGIASCLIRADLDIDVMAPTMVTVSLTTSAVFAGAMAGFASHIAAALGSADGTGPVRIMALTIFINGVFAVPGAQLTRDFKQRTLFLANVISLVPSTCVLLLLAKSGSGAMAFAWSRVVAQLVMGGVMFAAAPKHYKPGISRDAILVLLRFGLPLAGANFVNYILLNVDYAFVGHLIGAVALGIYMLAFNLASAPGFLIGNVINSISMPAFSRVKHDPDRLKGALASALRAMSMILMPMCGLMIALSRPIVLTLYGARWAAAADVLSILSVYSAISIICILFANMLTSLGKAKFILVVQLLWLCALIPAMALGVRRDGIAGAAIAHIAVIGPLILPSYLFVLKRATGVRLSMLGRAILPSLVAGSAAALAARGTASQFTSPLTQLVTGLAVGGLVYGVAAAPQAMAWLGQEQAAKLHMLRLYGIYESAARIAALLFRREPGYRRASGRHRTRQIGGAMRTGSVALTVTDQVASEGQDSGRDLTL